MIVTDERVARFISERLGQSFTPPYTVAGIERDGEIIAGVLFNGFQGADIDVTAAGKGWTRAFFRSVYEYVFTQLNCERMTFTTQHEYVARLGEKLGGRREGLLRSHFGHGVDGIIVGVLRDEWRLR